MKTINWKILNSAFWIEIILSYVLPFKVDESFEYKIGFPISFISIYNTNAGVIGVNPLMSMHLNPLGFLLNGVIIYLIISFAVKAYKKFKDNRIK